MFLVEESERRTTMTLYSDVLTVAAIRLLSYADRLSTGKLTLLGVRAELSLPSRETSWLVLC